MAERIRKIVFEQQQHRLGITVTDQEVQARWEKLTKGVDKDAAVQQQREMIGPLLSALQAVYEKGMDEQAAYEQFVARSMSREEWTIQLHYYRTPARRQILVNTMSQGASDLSRPDAGFADVLRQEKMNDAVDREIAIGDAEFRRYREALAKGEKPEGRFPPNYLEMKRHEWWADQYRKANITVMDERYRPVVDSLRSPAGEATTPTVRQSQTTAGTPTGQRGAQ